MSPTLLLFMFALTLLLQSPALAGNAAAAPERLSQTGLWAAGTQRLAPGVRPFAPRFALWSDGAEKLRWIWLPKGRRVDTRERDAWRFPVGTKLWKAFVLDGRPVETRFIEHTANGWRFTSYRWRDDGSDADRVPEAGQTIRFSEAPGGRYDFPSRADCLACHAGARSPVLGFAAVQLGPQLADFMGAGLLAHAPAQWATQPPDAPGDSAVERAARGYLHANCAHCHHAGGVPRPLRLALDAAGPAPAMPDVDVLLRRMATRNPFVQMPPLGTRHIDPQGLALLEALRPFSTPSESKP